MLPKEYFMSQNKTCKQCNQGFEVTDHELSIREKLSPEFSGKKFSIPAPEFCPDCRLQRRLAFRAGNKFFSRKCDLTGKPIVAMYSPEKPFKVYEHDAWWSDAWDALEYGFDYDPSKKLYDQLFDLFEKVPHAALMNTNNENSYFTNHSFNLKNSYLATGTTDGENIMYGYFVIGCNNTLDSASLNKCEYCYEGVASGDCNSCKYFYNSRNCSNCFIIENCQGCSDCIGCFGLKNKQYHLFNENVGKDEYEKYIKENLTLLTHKKIDEVRIKFDELKLKLPHRHAYLFSSEDCTGDIVYNSKNCIWSFAVNDGEDSAYNFSGSNATSVCDTSYTGGKIGAQYCLEVISTIAQSCLYSWIHWQRGNGIYTMECHGCSDCFACVGLKNKQYCIFNKQYSKEEYERIVTEILNHLVETGEWGKTYPIEKSMYAYNESVAQDFFPLTKEKATAIGFTWSDYEPPKPSTEIVLKASELPEDISQVNQDIVGKAIECEISGRPFLITPNELVFYKQQGIPLPTKHPDERHKNRMKLRNSIRLWKRNCDSCKKEIMSIYAPERPEIIYCEECYQKEML
jgi:hypothetical protein